MLKNLIRESLAFKGQIDEIDWESTFSDVKKTCIPLNELVNYLNRVINNANVDYGEREKFHKGMPFVHSKSSFFKKGEDLDLDFLFPK
jgi:hypothetical protein